MKLRPFGRTGKQVSEIGLGCWQLGGGDWGDVSNETAHAILTAAADRRTTFFDTSDVYSGGRSEEMIGRFLKERPEQFFVATKLGRFSDPGGSANITRETFRKHTEASLRRLGVDALDLTQLHCIPTERLREGEVFEWLRELQLEGKIKHFGASVELMEEASLCLEQAGLVSLQIIFNIFRQKPIETLFDRAKEQGVALIVRLPLASGLLTSKLTRETAYSESDHRLYNRDGQFFNVGETFAGLPYEVGVALAEELKPLVPTGLTMTEMALRWILDFDAVSVVIPGASRPEQAVANAAVSDLSPLSSDLHARLSAFYEDRVKEHIRGAY